MESLLFQFNLATQLVTVYLYSREANIIASNTHTVPAQVEPIRLQEYGVGIFDCCPTKSAFKKMLKKGAVTVNGKLATSATFITGGETINLIIAPSKTPTKKLIFPLDILFEDEHLAVIHKPAGILVSGNSFKTIANALAQNVRSSSLTDATQPQPIHRLDYPTTGVLLAGKTNASIRALNKLFETQCVRKSYVAVAIGQIDKKGIITSAVDDKEAITHYTSLASVVSERFSMLNLVKLNPITGRRHQLRKHLASIGNPILGDKEYGTAVLVLKGKGLYLHAFSIQFEHPFTKENIYVKSELPNKFLKLFPNAIHMKMESIPAES